MHTHTIKALFLFICVSVFSITEAQAQCISGNCTNGKGVMRFTSGATYTGEFYSGKMHGTGVLEFTNGNRYNGQWVNGVREGQGKMTFKNGNVYEGSFISNRMTGYGVMIYANKDKYVGNWLADQQHGKGTYFFKTKDKYEGDFAFGKFDGQGTLTYVDGARYSGAWKDNRKHGLGQMTTNTGQTTSGSWQNGEMVAQTSSDQPSTTAPIATESSKPSTSTKPTNSTSNSTATTASVPNPGASNQPDISKMRNCGTKYCTNGNGYYDFPDGSRYIGTFNNGLPYGEGTCYYANGDRYEGGWNTNAPNGEGIMYFNTGRVYGAVWVNGTPVSTITPEEKIPNVGPVSTVISSNVRIWAVVVGVSDYNHMPKLKYTDNDAYEYYSFLRSVEGGGLSEDQVQVLVDEEATRNNILVALQTQFKKADANDMVVMYFSGHGLEGCFLPYDYDGLNNRLMHKDILDIFAQSKAKFKLCIGDACHSGTLSTLAAKGPAKVTLDRYYAAFENSSGGTALLMSSKGEEVSLEDSGLRRGVFSHYLIKGLKGDADTDRNKIVSVSELYKYVYDKVRSYTQRQQTPVLTGDFDTEMPVGVVR